MAAKAVPQRGPFAEGLHDVIRWHKQSFNDTYINFSRDGLPIANRISDIVRRTAAIAEEAIVRGGGRKVEENGETVYIVNCDF
jgi:hypothetical protein